MRHKFPKSNPLVLFHFRRQSQPDDERAMLQEVGNPGFSPASAAVMELYREGKLSGETSILRGKNLLGANWQRVTMPEADLEGTNLSYADLRDAVLEGANLTKTDFRKARLAGADLRNANLSNTEFMQANLQRALLNGARGNRTSFFMAHAQRANMAYGNFHDADFQEADLHGADMYRASLSHSLMRYTNFAEANLERAFLYDTGMMEANLKGANLSGAEFDEQTILPDAQFVGFDDENRRAVFDKYWTPDTDMTRYTNPNHPNFWQPAWAQKAEWVKKNYEEN